MTDIPLDRFLELHDQLKEERLGCIEEAACLAGSTTDPAKATEHEIWSVLWDKPLYANVRVVTGQGWADAIRAEMMDAWLTWGQDPGVFKIRKDEPGRKPECFKVRGSATKCFVRRHSVPLHRLYAIQEAATGMRCLTKQGRQGFKGLTERPLSEIVPALCRKLGWGWGPVTVLHALTDMGLAVKPDRHLVNTMRELFQGPVDNPIRVNQLASALKCELKCAERTDIPHDLRYLDKVLMEISRQCIIPSVANCGRRE